ncbi:MAG TPA: hypothetical protein VG965_01065 [Patescibacteria group bacterium]|nr:hypothetical protein [Patescibacteria group bacterium]
MGFLLYPFLVIIFWYRDFFLASLRISLDLLLYVLDLLSIPALAGTFFKPLKGEYREGLVMFSVVMGMIIKSMLLLVCISIFLLFAVLVIALNLVVFILPIFIVEILFAR